MQSLLFVMHCCYLHELLVSACKDLSTVLVKVYICTRVCRVCWVGVYLLPLRSSHGGALPGGHALPGNLPVLCSEQQTNVTAVLYRVLLQGKLFSTFTGL